MDKARDPRFPIPFPFVLSCAAFPFTLFLLSNPPWPLGLDRDGIEARKGDEKFAAGKAQDKEFPSGPLIQHYQIPLGYFAPISPSPLRPSSPPGLWPKEKERERLGRGRGGGLRALKGEG